MSGWRDTLARAVHTELADLEFVQRDPQVRAFTTRLMAGGIRGLARSLAVFVVVGVRESLRALQPRRRPPPKPIVFFSFASNHIETLAPVARHLSQAYFTRANVFGRGALHLEGGFDADFPLGLAHLVSLPFLPLLLWRWMKARGWLREVFTRFFGVYWASYGVSLVAEWWLRGLNAAALVVANDHNTHTRVVVRAARALGIPTFYVQHASVTERFPPLAFDHALLDGEDAIRKYAAAGSTGTTVWLVGISKLDGRHALPDATHTVARVGVCTNVHDPLERVEELCRAVSAALPSLQVVLRPRPAGPFEPWIELSERLGVERSKFEIEPVADFLARVDVVIAGDSSVLLEAVLLDIVPLYYDFSARALDWYGFVRHGLASYAAGTEDAVALLTEWTAHRPSVRDRARYFCDTVGTEFEGRSGELAANVIRDVLDGRHDPRWHRVELVEGIATFRMEVIASANPSQPPHSLPARPSV